MNGVDEAIKRKIIGVIKTITPDAKIYLFGSRAGKSYRETSDIDVAIDTGDKVSRFVVAEISDMINASKIPFKVDVVDVHSVEDAMRKAIFQEGIEWTN